MKRTHETQWKDTITPEHWIAHHFDSTAQQYEVEVYVQVNTPATGIKHLLQWTGEIDEQELVAQCLHKGTFSVRPYTLGQGGDSTTGPCIESLYIHLCEQMHLDSQALYFKAYSKLPESGYDPLVIQHLAHWQGVTYPSTWSRQMMPLLLDDLASINNHALVTVLTEALPSLKLNMK